MRSTGLSIAGSVAGVLGLTNLHGLWFYALSVLLVNAAVLLVNAKGKPARYLQNHSVLDGAQENAFSFVLWWTFWYGIVHGKLITPDCDATGTSLTCLTRTLAYEFQVYD